MPISAVNSADKIRTDYMHLLVTQLQNQNPLEPMDNNDMAMQLATLSQLEQMENQSTQLQGMAKSFEKVLASEQLSHATSLIGKSVSFLAETGEGQIGLVAGRVDAVDTSNDVIQLLVGDQRVRIEDITGIAD